MPSRYPGAALPVPLNASPERGSGNSPADSGRLVVAFHLRAPIKNLRVALSDSFMQCEEFRRELRMRTRLQLEVTKTIVASHQSGTILADRLAHTGRNVTNRKADTAIARRVRRRAVHQSNVVKRHLAGREIQGHCIAGIHVDLNLLAAREQIVLVEGIAMG